MEPTRTRAGRSSHAGTARTDRRVYRNGVTNPVSIRSTAGSKSRNGWGWRRATHGYGCSRYSETKDGSVSSTVTTKTPNTTTSAGSTGTGAPRGPTTPITRNPTRKSGRGCTYRARPSANGLDMLRKAPIGVEKAGRRPHARPNRCLSRHRQRGRHAATPTRGIATSVLA